MDGLGRRLRASLRLKRGHGGPPQDNSGEALKEPERAQEHSLPNFAGGQHFFEYLLVVSLKKKRSQDDYEPIITYQFPKRENLLRGQQEEEERLLKAIPLFCFPDGNEWASLTEYPSLPALALAFPKCTASSAASAASACSPRSWMKWRRDIRSPWLSSTRSCRASERRPSLLLGRLSLSRASSPTQALSTLSQCIHAAAALLYPFSWAHTYIPVVPESLLATVCCPTPFMVGVQMRFQQEVMDSPMEEVLLVNLCEGTFLMSVGDEKDILPPKLQDGILDSLGQGINELKTAEQINEHVSGPFVQFFVKTVGHYASYIKREANGQGHFQERSFCKAVTSKTNRRFVKKFVKTQLFSLFIQEAEKSKNPPAGYFQQKILEYEEQKKQKKPREKTVK
ncbi:PREDICTED: DENN domain-containing protein 2D isoform X3 [Cercocebus atys]|uniref:DENN domain-containing protein 2D isoform X3 n=1 Tax=Cercocebus atys TaxID=9531 RepID=UPI0005F53D1F|nr:PREDICTED: DENN domain-containing protein 2D isoform X3 [Cercocebus atys]